ncbi:MAG: WHG domain-containing protein [Ruminococcus sp.]|nr:WHG domain-containing protein [Candidatus Apopatosoma intestinale]
MPPKVRISRDEIIAGALSLVRKEGTASLNARNIAGVLGCSTQPVFSNFSTMEELKNAVLDKAGAIYDGYLKREVASGEYPAYKASGMAYIRFADEEKELFKLLFMRDRSGEPYDTEKENWQVACRTVQEYLGVTAECAERFHMEMWALVHGIAVMLATNYLKLDWERISDMMSDVFLSLKNRYQEG